MESPTVAASQRLAALRRRSGVAEGATGVIIYFSTEWTAPIDAVLLPYITQQLSAGEALVLVTGGDDYELHGAAGTAPRVSCDATEFRNMCRDLGIKRLPMCTLVENASSSPSRTSSISQPIAQLVDTMRKTTNAAAWVPALAEAYPPLNTDAPALVQLREHSSALFEQGDFVGGATGLTRALVHCATCAKANFNVSVMLQMMDEMYFAVDHMLRVVAENDNDAVAHTVLRTVLHPAEPDLVVEGYESIVAAHGDHHRAVHSLATIRGEAMTAAPDYVRQVFDYLADTFEEKLVTHLEYRVPWQIVDGLQKARALPEREASDHVSAVDLGCGTGLCGRLLRPFASHIAGIDLSPLMVEKTQATGCYDEAETADIVPYLMSKADASLDLVVSADVWIYVGALDGVFPLVAQKLRVGGWFAFSTELLASGDGFELASSGRFKHSDRYILSLADQHGFRVAVQDEITVRKESGEPIPGRVFVLRREI